MRRLVLALTLAIAMGGCASVGKGRPLPVLLRYPPPERGGPTVFPQASPSGKLDLSGPCVRLQLDPARSRIIVSSAEASVGRDPRGLYLRYGEYRFRNGASVKGGGGGMDELSSDPLDAPVPPACRAGPFLILVAIRPLDPANVPRPKSPPPPPGR